MVIDKNLIDCDFTLKNAKDVSALKAVSQNLMHTNLSITDGIYGILSETDVCKRILSLGDRTLNSTNELDYEVLVSLLQRILREFQTEKSMKD